MGFGFSQHRVTCREGSLHFGGGTPQYEDMLGSRRSGSFGGLGLRVQGVLGPKPHRIKLTLGHRPETLNPKPGLNQRPWVQMSRGP